MTNAFKICNKSTGAQLYVTLAADEQDALAKFAGNPPLAGLWHPHVNVIKIEIAQMIANMADGDYLKALEIAGAFNPKCFQILRTSETHLVFSDHSSLAFKTTTFRVV